MHNGYMILVMMAFIVPPLVGFFLYHKVFKKLSIGDMHEYDITRDIPSEFGKHDFINRTTVEMFGICGEGRLEIFSDETVNALRAAHKRGVRISFIAGPVQICDEHGKAPLIELAKEGIINLFYSDNRQKEHFWIGDSQVFYEESHEPAAKRRTAYYFKDNIFEAKHFIKKFRKLQKSVVPYDPKRPEFILITQTEFDRAKVAIKFWQDISKPGIWAFKYCDGEELRKALLEARMQFFVA